MKPKLIGVKASKLVILALHDLEVSNAKDEGVTLHDITKYISDKYNVAYRKIKPSIHAVLTRGVNYGVFSKRNCRYRLEDVPEPPLMNSSKKKLAKLEAAVVKGLRSGIKRKKGNKSSVKVNRKLKSWMANKEANCCKDCRQMEKRRKLPPSDEVKKIPEK